MGTRLALKEAVVHGDKMKFQRTLQDNITLNGIALHSGKSVTLSLKPAAPHHGIVFVRTDLPGAPEIQAHYSRVTNTQLATTLGVSPAHVSTVEHLMAALQIFEIDNLRIEVSGPEVPILDGSARIFCEAFEQIGTQTQLQVRPYVQLLKKVEVRVNEKWAVAEPSDALEIHETVEWDHPAIGFQEFHFVSGVTPYSEIASARTFGFLKDVENLKRMGLALGGSLENAVVLNEGMVLNPEGLRYPNEFVRHKVLDGLGDFKLAGIEIRAKIRLHRAGHDLHAKLLEAIFKNAENFEIVDGASQEKKKRQKMLRFRPALARVVATL
jgi:UDP-3-O-[3-hydroxymyristoyl] N-acetylglucosamine deacetylase